MARARSLGRHGHFFIVVGLVAAWKSVTSTSFLSFVSVLTGSSPSLGSVRPSSSSSSQSLRQSLRPLRASELAIDWLEPLDPNVQELEPSGDGMVLPVFPLGGPFMPYSKHKLNIFEPRSLDRKIWDDHFVNSKRVQSGTDMINHGRSSCCPLLRQVLQGNSIHIVICFADFCSEIVKLG